MAIKSRRRQILIHGLALVLFELLWGFAVPHTPLPQLALGGHIQFVLNGMLIVLMALLLLALLHNVGARPALVMVTAACLTWLMVLSEVANAWRGTTEVLAIAAKQVGATGGALWQELIVKLTHIGAGIGLIVAWMLLIAGFVRKPATQN